MYTQRRIPISMPPDHLDTYLARGWYRMGQMIFTCQFLGYKAAYFSTIWIRLDLNLHKNSKSQRKLLRRNGEQFRHVIQPAILDAEKEALFQRYRLHFDGYLSPTLKHSMQGNTDHNIYNTYEISIYDGERLIAYSFFDLGQKAIASIKAVYDPDYGKHSLGYYTMLLEMEYAKAHNFDFYYPGYVVPGYSKFDYKTRIGKVDYYENKSRKWLPFSDFTEDQIPVRILKSKLTDMSGLLTLFKIDHTEIMYPLYEANMMGYWEEHFFEHPLSMICFPKRMHYLFFTITYDLKKDKFVLYECMQSKELSLNYSEEQTKQYVDNGVNLVLDLLVKKEIILETDSMMEVAEYLLPFKDEILYDDDIPF